MSDSLADLLAGAALGTALALAVLAMAYLVVRHGVITVGLFLAIWVLTTALRDAVDISITLSDVRVAAIDVLAVMTATVGVVRLGARGVRTAALGLGCLLFALVAVHLVRGLVEMGVETSVNSVREWFYFSSALIYAATVPGGWSDRVWKVLATTGFVLAALAVPLLLAEGVVSATDLVYRAGELVPSRPVGATGALLILQAMIIALAVRWPSRHAAMGLALFGGALLLLLQHRTLWAAGVVVGLTGFLMWAPRRNRDVALAGTAALLLLLPLAVWAFTQAGALVESASETIRSNSTLMWRLQSWDQLLSLHDSAPELALGTPSGEGFARLINGIRVTESPHNGFVDAYVRFGLPGVVVLISLGLVLWYRRKDLAVALPERAVGLLLLTQLIYIVAYSLDVVQGLVLGILVSGLVTGGKQGGRGSPDRHERAPPQQHPAAPSQQHPAAPSQQYALR